MEQECQIETRDAYGVIAETMLRSLIDLVQQSSPELLRRAIVERPAEEGSAFRCGSELHRLPFCKSCMSQHIADASCAVRPGGTYYLPSASEIREALRRRALREQFFGAGVIAEPVWGILLHLLLAHLEHRRVSIKEVTIVSGAASTTALRILDDLLARGLVRRDPDPLDGRRTFVSLTEETLRSLRRFFILYKFGA